jgi:ribose transport system substrate-binding protein
MVDTTKFKKDPPWTIAYANASTSNSWRIFTVAALFWAAKEYPDLIKDIVHVNANDSVPKQVSDMEDLMVKKVDAIIIASTSGDGLVPSIDKAMAAGIPVIILERGIDSDNYVSFIDVNPPLIARNQALWLVKQLNGQGNVVFYGVIPGITLSKWQEDAVRQVWKENPGIKELAFDYGMVSRAKGKELMEAWLQSFPQIDGVISWTGSEIQGAAEAAKEANRFDQIKAWVGADEQGYLHMIKSGEINGAGYYGYADCSVDALHAAIKTLKGEPVPKLWSLPVQMIDKTNIDNYDIPSAPDTWFPSRIPKSDVQKWLDLASTK